MTLLERLLGKSLPENMAIAPASWRNLSLVTALFYVALGAVNLWVAYTMSQEAWVFFKTWITLPLLFLFNIAIVFWLMRGYDDKDTPGKSA